MDGVRIVLEIEGLAQVVGYVGRLAGADTQQLMTDIGGLMESSMRERVEETKTAPDGSAWPPNQAGTSILLETGQHLRDSFAFFATPDMAEAGSSWEYAHVHQEGAVITPKSAPALAFMMGNQLVHAKSVAIPARPFAGMSDENARAIEHLATDWMGLTGGAR